LPSPSPTRRVATTAVALLTLLAGHAGPARAAPESSEAAHRAPLFLANGVSLPYPLDNLMRGWTPCTRRGHHRAIDIGGVGPDDGLGTPVRAMAHARVIRVGRPSEDPVRYGAPLTTGETTRRGRHDLPVSRRIKGYGLVHFFTRGYGAHRSGAVITLEGLSGPLRGYTLTYMHLAAIRPDLEAGRVVRAGEVIGLMGGTAVQRDPPHLHLEIDHPNGRRVDPGRILGIGPTAVRCRASEATQRSVRAVYQREAHALMRRLRRGERVTLSLEEVDEPPVADGDGDLTGSNPPEPDLRRAPHPVRPDEEGAEPDDGAEPGEDGCEPDEVNGPACGTD
jgi:murein DD-endopeptidase MepM/ murein hydrolase activator NlpD